MHRHYAKQIVGCALVFGLAGCGPTALTPPLGGGSGTGTPGPVVAPTAVTSPTANSSSGTAMQPRSPLAPGHTDWRVHTDINGYVAFDYPATWAPFDFIRVGQTDSMKFARADQPVQDAADTLIDVHIFGGVRPHDLQPGLPNERSFKVYAQAALSVSQAQGLVYLWGEDCAGCPAVLNATYYSPAHQLALSLLTAPVPREIALEAERVGLEAILAAHYPVFNQMMRSVRFLDN